SYTLIEALLAGVPVVSTRVGAAASLIRPGENGFLMDPEDAAGLAAIVRQFASHPDEVRALARRAAGIGKLYGIDRMIERTLGVYYAACRRSGGSGWKAAFNRRLTIR